MRILLTRPREDAVALAETLSRRGHEAIITPLMDIVLLDGPALTLEGVAAILATSANGLRALNTRSARRDLTVYAVGPQTADYAHQSGYRTVIDASGDSAQLVDTVARTAVQSDGVLFHAAGKETAGRVQQQLQSLGFRVKTMTLYEAVPVAKLPHEAADNLRTERLNGVMLLSPRSARIFAELVIEAGLAPQCSGLIAYCISAATAAGLQGLALSRVKIAATANQDAMLALLPDGAPDLPLRLS